MEPNVSLKDYVDKADEAVETRLSSKLDRLSTKGTVWAAAATILGVMLAVAAFGGDRFDAGMAVSPAVYEVQANQAAKDGQQDVQLQKIDEKLDVLIEQTKKP